MADQKISQLTSYTTPIGTDLLPIVDITNSVTKRIAASALLYSPATKVVAPSSSTTRADYYTTGTNDDVQIQAAINAVQSAGGGRVMLHAGTYTLGAQVIISASNVNLEGQGTGTIITQANSANLSSLLYISGINISQVKLYNFLVDGNKAHNTGATGILMQTSASSNSWVILQDLVVQNCPNNGVAWNANPGSSSYYIQRVHSFQHGGNGFHVPYSSGAALTDSVFDSCIADTNALNGFYLTTLDTHFTNCKSYFNGSAGGNNHGYYIAGYNNYFTNCQAQDNYQSGFYSDNPGDPTYGAQNCVFMNCDADSNNQNNNASYGNGFQLKNVSGWMLIGCQAYERPYPFSWTQRNGVLMEGTTNNTIVIGLTGSGNSGSLLSNTSSGTNFTYFKSNAALTLGGVTPIYSLIGPDGIKYGDITYDGTNMEVEVSSGDLNLRAGLAGGALGNINVWSLLGNPFFKVGNQNFTQALTFQHDGNNGNIATTTGYLKFNSPTGTKVTTLTASATISVDPTIGDNFTLTPAQDETLNMASVISGQTLTIIVTTSGTTSRTITFGTSFKSTGTLATGTVSGKVFTITFKSDGTNYNEVSRTTAM